MQQEDVEGRTKTLPEEIQKALEPNYASRVVNWITGEE